jgi:hypothetical protein
LVRKHGGVAYCDAVGPVATLIPELERRGITVETVSAQDMARACGAFFDMVEARDVRHLRQSDLTSALKGAVQRPLGDAWAWSRKNSAVDISPLVAATVALWGICKPARQRKPTFEVLV